LPAFSGDSAGARGQHLLQDLAPLLREVELPVAGISGLRPADGKRYRFVADIRGHDQWRGRNLRAKLSLEPPDGIAQEVGDTQRSVVSITARSRARIVDVFLSADQKADLRESGRKGSLVKPQADEHCSLADQRAVVRPRIRPCGTARVLRRQRRAELSVPLPRCSRSHPDECLSQGLRTSQVLDVNVSAIIGPTSPALALIYDAHGRSAA
jgi:hypothetical protein